MTSDINLDFDPADPSTGSATIYNLKITTDPTNPQVDCEGDGGLSFDRMRRQRRLALVRARIR